MAVKDRFPMIQRCNNVFSINGECWKRDSQGTPKPISPAEFQRECKGKEIEVFNHLGYN